MTERTRWIGLVVFIVICLGAGGLGCRNGVRPPDLEVTWRAPQNKVATGPSNSTRQGKAAHLERCHWTIQRASDFGTSAW